MRFSFIDDRDGTDRVYVVVHDRKAPDGFYGWSRHQVAKTNGHWTILRSYGDEDAQADAEDEPPPRFSVHRQAEI